MLAEEQIIEFQRLCKKRFGKEISREEAYEKGEKLVRLMELIYQPISDEEYLQLQKDIKE